MAVYAETHRKIKQAFDEETGRKNIFSEEKRLPASRGRQTLDGYIRYSRIITGTVRIHSRVVITLMAQAYCGSFPWTCAS